MRSWAAAADFLGRFDEIDRVTAVLVDSGRDCENVRVENDIVGIRAIGDQQLVGSLADLNLAL